MSMTTTWQPRHHRPSAPVCQVAQTAVHLVPPAPSATTAQHRPQAVHVSGTASHGLVIESNLTVEAQDVGIATTLALAVLLAKKSIYPQARDATVSWSGDDEAFHFSVEDFLRERKRRKTFERHPFVTATYLFAPNHTFTASKAYRRRAKLVSWRAIRSRIRGLHFVVFVSSNSSTLFEPLESVWDEKKGEGVTTCRRRYERGK